MPFALEEWLDLVRLLEQHPEWRSELRRLVLTDDVLSLPQTVSELAEAQRRTEQRLEELAEAQRRTEQRLEELAEAQRRTEQRLEELAEAQRRTEQRLEELAEAQQRTEQRLEELAEAQRRTEERLETLARRVEELAVAQGRSEDRLGRLLGLEVERRYREKAPSYFQTILRRIQLVEHQALGLMLDDAVDSGVITAEEKAELLLLDVVVRGHRNAENVYLAVEVSSTVDRDDVQRAASRAKLLERATGKPVVAAVAGEQLSAPAAEEAAARGVTCVLDGRVLS